VGRIEVTAFGSVRVRVDGEAVALAPRCLGVLIRLMLARGRWVGVDELYRSVWSSTTRVGRDERIAVQKAIAELRRRLDPDRSGPDSEVLVTDRGAVSSYRLVLDADSVDVYQFEDLLATTASTDPSPGLRGWERALALWTDRPLRGVADRPFVREVVDHLIELRGRACVEMVRAYSRVGRASEGLTILDRLIAAQPDDSQLRSEVDQLRQEKSMWVLPDAGLAYAHSGTVPMRHWTTSNRPYRCSARPGTDSMLPQSTVRSVPSTFGGVATTRQLNDSRTRWRR
jgi:DNA-binding SARP family transcriptional activator